MSNPYELNSSDRTNFSNEKDIAHRQDKIHRLSDHLSEGEASPSAGEARRPESKVRPASDRSSNARLEAEAPSHLAFAKSKTSLRRPLLFALLPVALIVGAYFYIRGGSVMTTDNAYVQSDMVSVSTDVSGIVSEVLVHDNQHVSAGDVLFKLDDLQYRLALGRANAQLANVKNDLMVLQANYRNMEAQIEQAKTDIDFFNTTFKRQQKLAATNVASQATFDDAFHNLQSGQQKLISLNQ
jgi:membrane fusion protein (multidrug efflux system)